MQTLSPPEGLPQHQEQPAADGRDVPAATPGGAAVGGAALGGTALRDVLAVATLGAAALHFGFAPVHFTESWTHGLFFLVVAWLQLAWALRIVTRPSRWLAWAGLANLGVIGVWIASRTSGIPFVPHGSVIEKVGYPDMLATSLEVIVVMGSLLLLHARAGARLRTAVLPTSAIVGAGVLVAALVSAGFMPRFAGAHAHGTAGHSHAAATLTGTTPCELAGTPASLAQVTDAQGHFHRGPTAQAPIETATRSVLAGQQAEARAAALRYPTVADAEAAGYRMSTPYVPCIGAHYTNLALVGPFNASSPSELLYDGTARSSRLVGLSYLVYTPGGPPQGFAGPNDHWHQHNTNGGLCFNLAGVVIGSESTSPGECSAMGGRKALLVDIWMLHDWVVPGWECSWGTFAPECPELGGRVGGSASDPPDKGAVLPAS